MLHACLLGEPLDRFLTRLDAAGTLERWAALAPELADAASVAELLARLAPASEPGSTPADWDRLLLGLLHLAAADGGADDDAMLLMIHAVARGASRLLRRFDAGLVVGQLAIQIRTYPWRTRHRAVAANLLLDTEHALCRETNNARMRTRDRARTAGGSRPVIEIVTDLVDEAASPAPAPAPASDDLDLVDVLRWARRTGVVGHRDAALLVEFYYAHEFTGAGHEHVAAVHGITTRTSKRRCRAALDALRAAAPEYLAS